MKYKPQYQQSLDHSKASPLETPVNMDIIYKYK